MLAVLQIHKPAIKQTQTPQFIQLFESEKNRLMSLTHQISITKEHPCVLYYRNQTKKE
jgi:hypothetical protein